MTLFEYIFFALIAVALIRKKEYLLFLHFLLLIFSFQGLALYLNILTTKQYLHSDLSAFLLCCFVFSTWMYRRRQATLIGVILQCSGYLSGIMIVGLHLITRRASILPIDYFDSLNFIHAEFFFLGYFIFYLMWSFEGFFEKNRMHRDDGLKKSGTSDFKTSLNSEISSADIR